MTSSWLSGRPIAPALPRPAGLSGGLRRQTAAAASKVDFADGKELRTEISAKFTHDRVVAELADAGLVLLRWATDVEGDYALSLSRPVAPAAA